MTPEYLSKISVHFIRIFSRWAVCFLLPYSLTGSVRLGAGLAALHMIYSILN